MMGLRKSKKSLAFTLAEVLITLTIIGVVAAISMPTIFYRQADETYIGKIKKFESAMQRVFDEIAVNGTPIGMWGWNGADDAAAADFIMSNYIMKKLKLVKYCGIKTGLGCGSMYLGLDGTSKGNWDNEPLAKAATIDGMTIGLKTSGACTDDDTVAMLCGEMMVDLNGNAKPNRVGRDIYYFGIYSNGRFMPIDFDKTADEINAGCKKGSEGRSCAAKIMIDGWSFKKSGSDKYPW